MQFSCSTQKLMEALQIATKALANRTSNQILEGILIEALEDRLQLTCSDERMTIVTCIDADIEEQGRGVVPGKLFTEIVRRLQVRSTFGLVSQNFNLFPHYTVLRNITEAPILIGKRNRDEVFETARELLRKMGLSDKESAYPCQLSGGQQQRVSIARALAMKPEILFFDEPTSALDPELTGEILHVIRDLAAEKMTMVIVTHEMQFARDVSDHLIFMDGGVIVEQGEPHEIINHPTQERTIQFLRRFSDRG